MTGLEMKSNESSRIIEICKLYMHLGNLNEGVAQFLKHIKLYNPVIGTPDLEFQHCEWLS